MPKLLGQYERFEILVTARWIYKPIGRIMLFLIRLLNTKPFDHHFFEFNTIKNTLSSIFIMLSQRFVHTVNQLLLCGIRFYHSVNESGFQLVLNLAMTPFQVVSAKMDNMQTD